MACKLNQPPRPVVVAKRASVAWASDHAVVIRSTQFSIYFWGFAFVLQDNFQKLGASSNPVNLKLIHKEREGAIMYCPLSCWALAILLRKYNLYSVSLPSLLNGVFKLLTMQAEF